MDGEEEYDEASEREAHGRWSYCSPCAFCHCQVSLLSSAAIVKRHSCDSRRWL